MTDVQDRRTSELWDEIDGRNYSGGQHDSLLRSLCWGNSSWTAMTCFIEVVRRLEQRIEFLERELDDLQMREDWPANNLQPWENADLTSDEDVVTDTLTTERAERLRLLADRFAA